MPKSIKLKDNTYIDTRGIAHGRQVLADIIYPVGSIYLCVNDVNPATLFGGTWQKMSGGYLYGCSSSIGNSSYTGSSTQSHTLTTNEIPSHKHDMALRYIYCQAGNSDFWGVPYMSSSDKGTADTRATGGGQGHSHNIAYIGVWVWKRTA